MRSPDIQYTYTLDDLLELVCEHLDERYEFPSGTFAKEAFTRTCLKSWLTDQFDTIMENAAYDLIEANSDTRNRTFEEAIARHLSRHKGDL